MMLLYYIKKEGERHWQDFLYDMQNRSAQLQLADNAGSFSYTYISKFVLNAQSSVELLLIEPRILLYEISPDGIELVNISPFIFSHKG